MLIPIIDVGLFHSAINAEIFVQIG